MGTFAAFSSAGSLLVARTYNSGTAATETVPSGASRLVIEMWGGGGAGGAGDPGTDPGGGGGGGGYCLKSIALTAANWGQTLTYSVGAGGVAGGDGGSSTVGNTTLSISFTMTAVGGEAGSVSYIGSQGFGGTAVGGDTNTSGEGGGVMLRTGAASPNGGASTPSGNGNAPGGGGAGDRFSGSVLAGDGGSGRIKFTYT